MVRSGRNYLIAFIMGTILIACNSDTAERVALDNMQHHSKQCHRDKVLCRHCAGVALDRGDSILSRLLFASCHALACIELQYGEALRVYGREQILSPKIETTKEELENILNYYNTLSGPITCEDFTYNNRYLERIVARHISTLGQYFRYARLLKCGFSTHYFVCPKCGYMCDSLALPTICPQCSSPKSRFRRY